MNRREIAIGKAIEKLAPRERRGSVTIFTNDQPVAIERLEVSGRLDALWIEERRRARAREELPQIAPASIEAESAPKETTAGAPRRAS